MDYEEFMDCVGQMLRELPPARKDAWILEQAKMAPKSVWQDFIMSLTGEKKIIYMPTEAEIEAFCKKVQEGEIYVEYETHYYEFDSEGRYMDDWKIWHNDPQGAFPFLDRAFKGCHELLRLGEYKSARAILDKICRLGFQVAEAEDTEDFVDDSPYTIADAEAEQKLSMGKREIGYDWLQALLMERGDAVEMGFAREFLVILQSKLCQELNLSDFGGLISASLLDCMEGILQAEIVEIDASLAEFSSETQYWQERHLLEGKRARDRHLLLDIHKKCKKQEKEAPHPTPDSLLDASWKEIRELLRTLSYERFIDDQLEIDEVWEICQDLIRRGKFEEEDWRIRKKILREMVSHSYYHDYGCYDPVKELADKLYITDAEMLEFAELLDECGSYPREAADLYRQYGRRDKYVQYLEMHLERSSREYVELIQCYCEDGMEDEARKVAEQGLKQCGDDLTELFIFLLKDAKACKEKERYQKIYASATRRKKVDIAKVNQAVTDP